MRSWRIRSRKGGTLTGGGAMPRSLIRERGTGWQKTTGEFPKLEGSGLISARRIAIRTYQVMRGVTPVFGTAKYRLKSGRSRGAAAHNVPEALGEDIRADFVCGSVARGDRPIGKRYRPDDRQRQPHVVRRKYSLDAHVRARSRHTRAAWWCAHRCRVRRDTRPPGVRHQCVIEILPCGIAIDFDRHASLSRQGEHRVPIGDHTRARSSDPTARVRKDPHGRMRDGSEHAVGLVLGPS